MTSEVEIYCNASQCHQQLHSSAWVTHCLHIFCEKDTKHLLHQVPSSCPACGVNISSKDDLLRVDLEPSEQMKAMMLAGLRPEIIMDICSKGLTFWSYQVERERNRQLQKFDQMRAELYELEQYYENIIRKHKNDMMELDRQLQGARKEIGVVIHQKETLSTKLDEKNKQHQKLKVLYDALRRNVPRNPGVNKALPYSRGPPMMLQPSTPIPSMHGQRSLPNYQNAPPTTAVYHAQATQQNHFSFRPIIRNPRQASPSSAMAPQSVGNFQEGGSRSKTHSNHSNQRPLD